MWSAKNIKKLNPFFFSLACFSAHHGYASTDEKNYVLHTEKISNSKALGRFEFNGKDSGKLIQSMAFDSQQRKWLVAVSTAKNPEVVELWQFPELPPYRDPIGPAISKLFSHPQDLSSDALNGKRNYWLPSQNRTSVVRFEILEKNKRLDIKVINTCKVSKTPIKGLFVTVSTDDKNLIVMGHVRGLAGQHVMIYSLKEFLESCKTRETPPPPISSWPLNSEQLAIGQWRQGLASIGDRVFILTGNHDTNKEKLLYTYTLKGDLISKNNFKMQSLSSSETSQITYEPEGLEIFKGENRNYLIYGIAEGEKGNRTFNLYKVPLRLAGH